MEAFVLLLLLLSIASHRLQCAEGCYDNERRALLAIKSDMYDHGSWFSSWTGNDCCKWRGVSCDNATSSGGHVIKLDLRYPSIDDNYYDSPGVSKVNPSLLELKRLMYLDLSMNNFNGTSIPKTVASLVHLEYLNLSNSMFAGLIPSQLGNLSSLSFLDLQDEYGNYLYSHDLDWLSRIPSLKYLDMSYVDLSGAIGWLHQINSIPTLQALLLSNADLPSTPSPLPPFNLTSISMLDLSVNFNLDDSLLRWMSKGSSSLEYLHLESCFLEPNIETIQLAIAALSNLKELYLANNNILGEISIILMNASRRLEHLDLGGNSLTGDIPQMLGNLTRLQYLSLQENQIGGEISPNVGNLVHLEFLDLSDNHVSGSKPASMGNFTNLVYLDLSVNNIMGELSQSFGNLYNLVYLDLSWNKISRGMPKSFGNLSNLKYMNLDSNNISGQLPQTFGNLHNLQYFYLYNNSITGEIPETLGKLDSLENLDISNNQLSGRIPRMASLCNLSTLDLSHNNIGAELTDLLNDLSSNCPQGAQLWSLNLIGNNLSGTIPPSLGQFSQLSSLDLSSNLLTGNITEAHFSDLANLDTLNISYNSLLNVILPNDWQPPFNASTIDMSFCHVRGSLPYWIQSQRGRLRQLYLSAVGLSGDLPTWFSDFILEGVLEELVLNSNNLSGPLPFTTTNLMDLSNNLFVGPIPFSFMDSTETSILSLSYNHINGTIPSSFCNLTSLGVLDLSRNRLSGEVPNCHGSLPSSLLSLHLNENNLSGPLPPFLAYCKDLATIDLGENKFYGEIPAWLGRNLSALKVLRLRSNILNGVIPVNLANLSSVQVLDLSFNRLHGSIPSSIGKLGSMIEIQNGTSFNKLHPATQNPSGHGHPYTRSGTSFNPLRPATKNPSGRAYTRSCTSIDNCRDGASYSYDGFYKERITITTKGSTEEYTSILSLVTSIDLSNNNLSGKIPEELTNLLGLCFLSLSNNHLIGNIPQNIGSMKQLLSLDLSVNNLTGAIPSSLSALISLELLNLSYNELSGRIPKGNQLQTFDPSLFEGNKDLCGLPLRECPTDDAVPYDADDEENGRKLETILNYAFIVLGFVVGFWVSVGTLILKQSMRITLFQSVDKLCDRIYVQLAIRFAKQKT